ncbi:MAG: hypothetical protein HQL31_04270, partial [Planctomycetes bacterium]|nr:hypothetical protein [Planctomycetota bacterium]
MRKLFTLSGAGDLFALGASREGLSIRLSSSAISTSLKELVGVLPDGTGASRDVRESFGAGSSENNTAGFSAATPLLTGHSIEVVETRAAESISGQGEQDLSGMGQERGVVATFA